MKKLGNVLIEVMQDLSRVSTNGEATVKVNRTMCSPERFEQLFNYFSKGTILERINLNVQPMDSKLECGCGYAEVIDEEHNGYDRCPQCGRFADIKDTDYQLVDPHPEKAMERKSIRF
ncbi:MAG: hydrogenase maturation nickel metallochaperone HypA [Nanohaloarchaea archaeon]|nr:hydrogenase maturation nickel metallochaperone HypA [Candidatus Nanohaloarchaea archaeon]